MSAQTPAFLAKHLIDTGGKGLSEEDLVIFEMMVREKKTAETTAQRIQFLADQLAVEREKVILERGKVQALAELLFVRSKAPKLAAVEDDPAAVEDMEDNGADAA